MKYKNKWLAEINKQREAYRDLCNNEPSICIFLKDYWQDAVCVNDQWSAVLYEKGGIVLGSLVFCYDLSKHGIIIHQPILTQTNGVWIRKYAGTNYYKKLEYEKEVFSALINSLENLPIVKYSQHFTVDIINWLPFYWKNFSQTTRYSYRINDITDVDSVVETFSQAKRKNIKHAIGLGINYKFDINADEFYNNHKMTLVKQNSTIVYTRETLNKIFSIMRERKCGRTIYAYDNSGNIHAALLIIWDSECAFDLISTIDPDYRNSGAATMLINEMLKYLSSIGIKQFDFEGSMIENVENSFRQFGTMQLPYFSISKDYRSRLQKLNDCIKLTAKAAARKGLYIICGKE